ncbi:MAG: arginine--tRNA ligase [Gammaproteobacteria bacterium]
MKDQIAALMAGALETLKSDGVVPEDFECSIRIDATKDATHGDFASNLAMILAKPCRDNPRSIATKLVGALPASDIIDRAEIAGPGFINFFVREGARSGVVGDILQAGDAFGRSDKGAGTRVQVEFVSANPTGPLHVGHGRGAAYGATVANLLEAVGFDVQREYYVNDAGRQMDILAASVWLRYLELGGAEFEFPSNGYQGDYVQDIAATLRRENGESLEHPVASVFEGVPADAPAGGDKEQHIDGLIDSAKRLLGSDGYRKVFDAGLNTILDDIRDDLGLFGAHYDEWFSERSLMDNESVPRAIEKLKASGHVYESNGALWFRSTDFGDEKDRVVVRDNGQTTYFASDIAYHLNKLERGFDRVIDVWGADHHGYVPRVKAAMQAMGANADALEVLLVQFAVLYRGGEKVQMSTRSGEFVTLRQLRKEVGADAARFFYVMRRCEQHLDFDLDLAKSQSSENPVYYIQYAHARVASVFRQLAERGIEFDSERGLQSLDRLSEAHEEKLISRLATYSETLEKAAMGHEPHVLAHYLRDLANDFHTYYNAHQFLVDDQDLREARLCLITATRQVIRNGLLLLGVSAPDEM